MARKFARAVERGPMARLVFEVRQSQSWTQQQMAEHAGLSIACVRSIEQGTAEISTWSLLKVGEVSMGAQRAAVVEELRKRLGPGACVLMREVGA